MIFEYFRGIWRDRYILFSLVNKDLQQKYRRSKLGVAWSIVTPLCLALIIGSVYSLLFGADPKFFIPMLFTGLNPWTFISGSADGGATAYLGAEGYLKQTNVNAQIFPLRTVLVNFVNLLYSVAAFFAFYMLLQPDAYGPKMLLVVPGLIILFFFVLAIANFSATINLNIRDFSPLQSLMLQGLFYATPIIYDETRLQSLGFSFVYELNPFFYVIDIIRKPMLGLGLPPLRNYLIAIAITVILLLLSIRVVMRSKQSIVFKL